MRRLHPLFALLASTWLPTAAHAQSSVTEFDLSGSARILDKECIRLTPDEPRVGGSAWFKQAIDLSQPFEMKMSLVLGRKDLEGADGIAFVFTPTRGTGIMGEGMGFAGLYPSLGIEIDTYQNFHLDDPFADHLAVMLNGRSSHAGNRDGLVELGNLEDGVRHPLRIVWSPDSGLRIYLDDKLRGTTSAGTVKAVFGAEAKVFWGMTAATGRLSNRQDVCIEKLFMGV